MTSRKKILGLTITVLFLFSSIIAPFTTSAYASARYTVPDFDESNQEITMNIDNQNQHVTIIQNFDDVKIFKTIFVFDEKTSKFWPLEKTEQTKMVYEQDGIVYPDDAIFSKGTWKIDPMAPKIDENQAVFMKSGSCSGCVTITKSTSGSYNETKEWTYSFNSETGLFDIPTKERTSFTRPFTTWTQNMILFPEKILSVSCKWYDVPCHILGNLVEFGANKVWKSNVHNTNEDNSERIELMLNQVDKFDIVALQEVWDNFSLKRITNNAVDMQNYVSVGANIKNTNSLLPGSGLMLLLENDLPVTDKTIKQTYRSCGGLIEECAAKKGFTIDKVHLGPHHDDYMYIVNTHLYAKDNNTIKIDQLKQLSTSIDRLDDPKHPVLFLGDFNVAEKLSHNGVFVGEGTVKISRNTLYFDMLKILGAEDLYRNYWSVYHGPLSFGHTSDHQTNAYAHNWGEKDNSKNRLDYILVRQGTEYRIEVDISTTFQDSHFAPIDVWNGSNNSHSSDYNTSLCKKWVKENQNLNCYWSDHWGVVAGLSLVYQNPADQKIDLNQENTDKPDWNVLDLDNSEKEDLDPNIKGGGRDPIVFGKWSYIQPGNGYKCANSPNPFDFDNDGFKEHMCYWYSDETKILFVDFNDNKQLDNGYELLNTKGYSNGLEIIRNDPNLCTHTNCYIWQDVNSNILVDDGELQEYVRIFDISEYEEYPFGYKLKENGRFVYAKAYDQNLDEILYATQPTYWMKGNYP